jgi:3-methyladenine DNA glycosylase AlkD
MTSQEFVKEVVNHYQRGRNPQKAKEMSAYMRNLFPYLGISRPERDKINKPLFILIKNEVNENFLKEVVTAMWQKQEREYHYFALDLLSKFVNHLTPSALPFLTDLAVKQAWWDSIDYLASKIIGKIILKYPDVQQAMDRLSIDDNNWLKRIAILHQLSYKQKTDPSRLFHYCLANAANPDFFIRKGIGWALRAYAKTNRQAVIDFVEANENTLSKLSKREALRRLK